MSPTYNGPVAALVFATLFGCDTPAPQKVTSPVVVAPIASAAKDAQASIEIESPEILSTFSSEFSTQADTGADLSAHNIRIAARKLAGVVIDPGGEFSFNKTVGNRTADAGYLDAPVLFMGTLKPGMGGGICRVSSTLYIAAMRGDMTITRRHPHSRPLPTYKLGMDAAVNYPNIDLRFKNPYAVPITIVTTIVEGTLTVALIGVENPFHWVTMDYHPLSTIPFESRSVHSKWVKKPRRYQAGKIGTPGYSDWAYAFKGGAEVIKTKRVESNYKPLEEIWVVNKNIDGGSNDTK